VLNGANPLKYPDGYRDYFDRMREHEAQISKTQIETAETTRSKNAVNEARNQATKLYQELSNSGRQAYYKRIKSEFPTAGDDFINSERLVTDTILDDIMSGSLNPNHFTALKPMDHTKRIGS
jgi:hypothetical protein